MLCRSLIVTFAALNSLSSFLSRPLFDLNRGVEDSAVHAPPPVADQTTVLPDIAKHANHDFDSPDPIILRIVVWRKSSHCGSMAFWEIISS